jgi:ABC-type uncharacterized transport system permease subunit
LLNVLVLTLALGAPLILAAMGGLASERSGVINISLEGLMLTSCCVVALASIKFGPFLALSAGVLAATALSTVHWVATQIYRIDHVVSGMAINALAAGGTNYLYVRYGATGSLSSMHFFSTNFYIALALATPLMFWQYFGKTRAGLRISAVGNDPEKSRLAGLHPVKIRFATLLVTGVLTGLAGATLVSYTGVFTTEMTAGRGYIALAALILGGWRPLPTLAGCLAFGFLSAVRLQFQGVAWLGVPPPSQLWAALPYLATVFALAGFVGKLRTPPGLGKY